MTRHTLLDMDFTNMCDPTPVLCPSDNQQYEANACAPNDSPGSSNPPRTVSSKEAPSSNLEATILHQLSTVVEQLELQRKRIDEIAATKTSPDSVNNMSNSEQVVNTNGAGYVVGRISGDFAAKLCENLSKTRSKDAFCDALCDDRDMVWQIQRTRPTNVEDAVRLAVELEAHRSACDTQPGKIRSVDTPPELVELQNMKKKISDMNASIEKFKSDQRKMSVVNTKQPEHKNQSPGNTNNYNTSRGATNGNGSASFRNQRYDHNNRWHHARSGHGSRANKRAFGTPNETGLHIKSIIQSVNVNALIDTGATISFLSKKSFDSIPRNNRPELKYVAARYSTANGGLMAIYGKADFLIEIYGHNYPHTLVVADIGSQCILGLDFMNANEVTINLKRKTITLNGNTYETHLEEPGICRVSLCENTCVPSGHEVVVNGYIPLECVK
ncbi:hypothetical protein LOTGIDRAFT_162016 [Lottia gigantea]|uniref:Peptidase A2 domain-containing protein n=1 Tax=Lottia gigantea TaxID=225164 RepID=V4A8E1_LOTGI|nr:hypothetical protein LOTGIDRAFT_162016 [Lottia gigantea]ESO92992.1 hypothetical protein LOTGIDRAFT_162016 [Lottia gigantea]